MYADYIEAAIKEFWVSKATLFIDIEFRKSTSKSVLSECGSSN